MRASVRNLALGAAMFPLIAAVACSKDSPAPTASAPTTVAGSSPVTAAGNGASTPPAGSVDGSAGGAGAIPEPGPGTGTKVTIQMFLYRPDPLTTKVGSKVTFENQDGSTHSITSGKRGAPDGFLDKDLPGRGTTVESTFDKAGTYEYFCKYHDGMDASIIVA